MRKYTVFGFAITVRTITYERSREYIEAHEPKPAALPRAHARNERHLGWWDLYEPDRKAQRSWKEHRQTRYHYI
jgi:hypothetical protein